MPDPIFETPRLAAIYDDFDSDRSDLDVYEALVDELGARSVLDVGCGTGNFACRLTARGVDVVGIDPAAASLQVAREKPGADRVRWIHGYAPDLPPLQVDLAIMTGNVAQVFVTDEEWGETLRAIKGALRTDGHLVFETRNPAARAWLDWGWEHTHRRVDTRQWGTVEGWADVLDVGNSLVTFRWTYVFERDGVTLTSDSTLRFRDRAEVSRSLEETGLTVEEVREAPDRPGLEHVFIARPVHG
jgi:SAM-dependent methyltransferase